MPQTNLLRRWIVAWFAVGILFSPVCMGASADDSRSAIRSYLAQAAIEGLSASELTVLRTFYEQRADAPVWSGSPEADNDAQTLQSALAQAAAEGLNAADYRVVPMV